MPPRAKKKVIVIPDAKRVCSYVRVSTEYQDASGQGQREQRSAIEAFCLSRGLELVEDFSDVLSGYIKSEDREGLSKALKFIEDGHAGGLVVYKLDRLGRGSADTIKLIDDFNLKGVKFYSVFENIDCTTDIGKAMFGFLSVFANLERDMIKSRVQVVMDGKKKRHEKCGRTPIGKLDVVNEKGVKILVDNPAEIAIIKLVRKLRGTLVSKKLKSGKISKSPMTYLAIADELMRLGVKNRAGEVKWFPSQMAYIMKIKLTEDEASDEAISDEAISDEVNEPGLGSRYIDNVSTTSLGDVRLKEVQIVTTPLLGTLPKVIGYIRVHEKDDGDHQVIAIENHCKAKGWELYKTFRDKCDGSVPIADRFNLQRGLSKLVNDGITIVVCVDHERISSNGRVVDAFENLLGDYRCRLETVS